MMDKGPSRLCGATCDKHATQIRDGPGSGTPGEGENRDFRAEHPRGTLRRPAPIIWYHCQTENRQSTMFVDNFHFYRKIKQIMKTTLFGHPSSPSALGTAHVEKNAKIYSG